MTMYPEFAGPALQAHREAVQEMKRRATRELNVGEDQIVVRDLLPQDLGGSASTPDFYCNVKALGFGDILAKVNDAIGAQTVGDNRWLAIEGVALNGTVTINTEPPVQQLRITRKGSVARYWTIGPVALFEHAAGWADDPVIVDQNTTVQVEALARTAGTTSALRLLGTVVEKRGLLINP
jgi:hypothetical protein